jgi:tRNA(Ile)-lysidine synthase
MVPGNDSLALLRTLRVALAAPHAPGPGEHLLVAVSAGPDSTALLAGLVEIAPARNLRLTTAHVDHRLRGAESDADRDAAEKLARKLGVPFVVREAAVEAGSAVEARARSVRYRALAAMASEVGATRIVTGHTRDDQVETILLRLLRGAGRRGLAGMRLVRGRLFRPLLGATRTDVRRFLAERGLGFTVDRTNADLRLVRNRVRRVLIPWLEAELNPRLGRALAALAERLADEDDLLDALARTRARSLGVGESMPVAVAEEPRALARRLVRAWLQRGSRREPSAAHVERVLGLADGTARGTVAVPGPARVVREGDVLVRRAGRAATPGPFRLPIAPGATVAHPAGRWTFALGRPRARRRGEERAAAARAIFDADALPAELVVRPPTPGDRIALLGGGTRKLQDVLVDAKVPREARAEIAVLASADEILWVAGLARGRAAPVRPETKRVVEATFDKILESSVSNA